MRNLEAIQKKGQSMMLKLRREDTRLRKRRQRRKKENKTVKLKWKERPNETIQMRKLLDKN